MSRILVVEPHKMLQHAIALSFFPDHDVQVAETLPDAGATAFEGYDVIVLDAAALREKGELSAPAARAIQSWRVPLIWLESEDASNVSSRERFVVVQRPMARDRLLAALAQCLGVSSATKPQQRANGLPKEIGGAPNVTAKQTAAAADEEDSKIIEPVEIVDEGAHHREKASTSQRSKK